MPQGCDAVNDDGVCIKKQTPWVNFYSLLYSNVIVGFLIVILQERKASLS
jgi:hypothetical protein